MKRLLPFVLAVLVAGCDTSGIEVESGRFSASLSGALTGSVEGTAGFALGNCASFSFYSEVGRFYMTDNCKTKTSHNQTGPVEGTFAFRPDYEGPYFATYQVGADGPIYRAVDGEIDIVDRDRTRTRGRFSMQASPLDSDGHVIEDGEVLLIEGEFDAEGFDLIY